MVSSCFFFRWRAKTTNSRFRNPGHLDARFMKPRSAPHSLTLTVSHLHPLHAHFMKLWRPPFLDKKRLVMVMIEIQAKFFADTQRLAKTRRKFGAKLHRFPCFDFQEKWPQETSLNILRMLHKGRNRILSPRDSGSRGARLGDLDLLSLKSLAVADFSAPNFLGM